MSLAMDQKLQISKIGNITQHWHLGDVMTGNITFFDTCSFWSVTVNIMDKQLFFFYIYHSISCTHALCKKQSHNYQLSYKLWPIQQPPVYWFQDLVELFTNMSNCESNKHFCIL